MALFRQAPPAPMTPRAQLENKYNTARANLLVVVILTAVNILLLLTRNFSYFLFSASIPYLLVDLGMTFCGKYPPEYYTDALEGMTFVGDGLLIALSAIAFVILGVYLLLWYLSRRHAGCLTAALVLFSLDTLFLLIILTPSISGLLDLLFHGILLYALIVGVRADAKRRHLPPEDITDTPFTELPTEEEPKEEEQDEGEA